MAVGCGPAERRDGGAELRVTRDFGHKLLSADMVTKLRGGQTALSLLSAGNEVATRDGGRAVHAVGGIEGGRSAGWFYWVNGLQPDDTPARYELSPGDVVQWDYRRRRTARDVRAIVGAFPEPFVRGVGGKRFPVRVECEDADSRACRKVKQVLLFHDVPATGAALGASGSQNVIRVVVARWRRARGLPTARRLEVGPRASGVFARFTRAGRALELLDESGRTERTAPAGYGLVATLRPADKELVWLVTGVDEAGVVRAAGALDRRSLRDAFAVAVGPGGVERLPVRRER